MSIAKNITMSITLKPKKSHHKAKPPTIVLRTSQPIDAAPEYLGVIGKTCYQRIVADLVGMGVADRADSKAVEAFASAYEEYRKMRKVLMDEGFTMLIGTGDDVHPTKRPEVDIMTSSWSRMRTLLPELYLTPAARAKAPANTKPSNAVDPWADLIPEAKS